MNFLSTGWWGWFSNIILSESFQSRTLKICPKGFEGLIKIWHSNNQGTSILRTFEGISQIELENIWKRKPRKVDYFFRILFFEFLDHSKVIYAFLKINFLWSLFRQDIHYKSSINIIYTRIFLTNFWWSFVDIILNAFLTDITALIVDI